MARVRVAEMRLYHEDRGEERRRAPAISTARCKKRSTRRAISSCKAFLSKSPTMVDYLHLEILQSLAHDDDRLLGHNYPGPMV